MTRINDLVSKGWKPHRATFSAGVLATNGLSALSWKDVCTADFTPAWDALGSEAETRNPFYERWFLKPSLEQFDPEGRVRLVIFVEDGKLCGLMPLCHRRTYHDRSLPHLAAWTHPNLFCGEPLIAPGFAERFWSALLDWADTHERASLFVHLPALPADGSSLPALRAIGGDNPRPVRIVASEERASLLPGASPDEHLERNVEKKRRKEFARKRRRLEEMGHLAFTRCEGDDDLEAWIDDFLMLEAAGWKGQEGSALACAPQTAALFRASLTGAASAGALERLAFHLDGKPVAMLCNFIASPLSFAFKTTYDEALSKLSPGVLLQVENLALLGRMDIAMSDSCAAPGHPMIDHLWFDRRQILKVSLPIGGIVRKTLGSVLTGLEERRMEKRA